MDNERRVLPKNAFDSEYMTEFLREVRFLTERGIKYTFVRKTPDYGISQYKYRKTPQLFAALVEFYSRIEAERDLRKAKKAEEKVEPAVTAPAEEKPVEEKPAEPEPEPEIEISPEKIAEAKALLKRAEELKDDTL